MKWAIFFAIKLTLLIAAAVWLAENPGVVQINWQGYRLDTSFGMLVLLLLVVALILTLLFRLYGGLLRSPLAYMRHRAEKKRRQGYLALTQGLVAVAAGDPEEAKRLARKADSLLEDPPLTMLLSAQAAQLNGDDEAAERYFTAMLKRPETEFLGLRGLLTQAMRKGDRDRALALVKRAHKIRPDTPWVLTTLLDLQVKDRRWDEALLTVRESAQAKALPEAQASHNRAALLVERSRAASTAGDAAAALEQAKRAHSLAPDFIPATAIEARLLIDAGKHKRAAKLIEAAWAKAAHPDLARLYDQCWPGENALLRLRRFQKLEEIAPNDIESLIAVAEAALAAQLWGEARAHLDKAIAAQNAAGGATARTYRVMAAVVEAEYGDAVRTRDWLNKAALAHPDPAWICHSCGAQAEEWSSLCGNCGSFDSQEWRTPPRIATTATPEDAEAPITTPPRDLPATIEPPVGTALPATPMATPPRPPA
ncbi:MAG: heme biosynthesis protein HemY [Alphaproteobacteria bacterium]|nr:heme biosynthesis protein HemY [Alphaproteobacteria bacterium]MBU0796370.1 heme biosynthesis protein HemY [Alphaproteobacteria bacterium]MBU0888597.1 heme biosynthesis protein HemY [Alphaproteobacteria bacterium]MBU1813669.1 heme biosynthesis protein HemY [Alphaproteobacteria bacterium]